MSLIMKKILYPTDFTETSENAFLYALNFAKTSGAEIIILHVYPFPSIKLGTIPENIERNYTTYELEKLEEFKTIAAQLRKIAADNNLSDIKLTHVLRSGQPLIAIENVAQEEGVELIVMGTKGSEGLQETLLGSTTGNIIMNCKCWVLGVPQVSHYNNGIKNITFTTRFKDKDKEALTEILNFLKSSDTKITCLHIKSTNTEIDNATIEEWKKDFKETNLNFEIRENNDIQEGIFKYLEESKSDLLVMLTYKRGFFGEMFERSVSRKLSYHTETPILVLHEANYKLQ